MHLLCFTARKEQLLMAFFNGETGVRRAFREHRDEILADWEESGFSGPCWAEERFGG